MNDEPTAATLEPLWSDKQIGAISANATTKFDATLMYRAMIKARDAYEAERRTDKARIAELERQLAEARTKIGIMLMYDEEENDEQQ